MTNEAPIRLTSLSHGGGCGCKIAPDVLANLIGKALPQGMFPKLLVGTESADDAAVYLLNDEQALIATTDFFMPIVDNPHDFGRIAATNALSDIYAMGGKPIMALAIVGMPINQLPHATIAAILAGGASVCQTAGVPIAGGHSIDSVEPIYGLAVMGLAHPQNIRRNNQAQAGDALILAKGLGVGIFSAAFKQGRLSDAGYQSMLASTTQLNSIGTQLACLEQVHALTDVTGFGLLGHTLEICKGSGLQARLNYANLPLLEGVATLAGQGIYTGASGRNLKACEGFFSIADDLPAYADKLLSDPQTSGGLLIACHNDAKDDILQQLHQAGYELATHIGELNHGDPYITIS